MQQYRVLKPFALDNQTQQPGAKLKLATRQVANLVAGGFIVKVKPRRRAK